MSGHGHVTPNADGSKARCGGPGICTPCSREKAALDRRFRELIEMPRLKQMSKALTLAATRLSICAGRFLACHEETGEHALSVTEVEEWVTEARRSADIGEASA